MTKGFTHASQRKFPNQEAAKAWLIAQFEAEGAGRRGRAWLLLQNDELDAAQSLFNDDDPEECGSQAIVARRKELVGRAAARKEAAKVAEAARQEAAEVAEAARILGAACERDRAARKEQEQREQRMAEAARQEAAEVAEAARKRADARRTSAANEEPERRSVFRVEQEREQRQLSEMYDNRKRKEAETRAAETVQQRTEADRQIGVDTKAREETLRSQLRELKLHVAHEVKRAETQAA